MGLFNSLFANTVPRTHGEGLQDIAMIVDEARIGRVDTGEPAIGMESLRVEEVCCRLVGCQLGDRDDGLPDPCQLLQSKKSGTGEEFVL